MAKMKRVKRGRTLHPSFTLPEGPQAATEAMATHLEQVFAGQLLQQSHDEQYANDDSPTRSPTTSTPTAPFTDDDPFDNDLIAETIAKIPIRKAPGIDHIRGEMIRPITASLTP
ncbi:hypothetical protein DFQ28_003797, partial [Apophysomyces sp. BC1034]